MKKFKHIISSASLLVGFLGANQAWAAPEYISNECDVRILSLSHKQRTQLHNLRQNWKENRDQIQIAARRKNHETSVRVLMNKNGFDANYARRIAQENYNEEIQLAIAELQFHYQVFHSILTESQKKLWIDYCIIK